MKWHLPLLAPMAAFAVVSAFGVAYIKEVFLFVGHLRPFPEIIDWFALLIGCSAVAGAIFAWVTLKWLEPANKSHSSEATQSSDHLDVPPL